MNMQSLSDAGLIQACASGRDDAAWSEFVRRFRRTIATAVMRVADEYGERSAALVEDLVQETYLTLCGCNSGLLRAFQPLHPESAAGFIKVVALNLARDHFRRVTAKKRGSGAAAEPLDSQEGILSAGQQGSTDRQVVLLEISRCLDRCITGPNAERDRLIFWLYFRLGLSATEIARLPSIPLTCKGVESTILRLIPILRKELNPNRSSSHRDEGLAEPFPL